MNACRLALLLLAISVGGGLTATAQEGEAEDPMQRFPEGVTEPEHRIIPVGGGEVDDVRVHPPFWWVGMDHGPLQILIYDTDISRAEVSVDHPGVTLLGLERVENPNYLFVNLDIGPGARPGPFNLVAKMEEGERVYGYELLERDQRPEVAQGLDPSDVIYLIMPDRFANGNPRNDSVNSMEQTGVQRDKLLFRHGGDLDGVIDRLDYLADLGVTAIWLNPVLENDQAYESYHGYAITDHYRVDPRMGDNLLYRTMVQEAHARGIKVVMDIVHNHVGLNHWFIRDLPDPDWIHQFEEFTQTTYRAPTLMDPYAAEADKRLMTDGWFDRHMPDLNQAHPLLATYLIQNHLWWTEFSGHDAYRIDTYAYNDQAFMAQWAQAMLANYDRFNFFGETWVHGPAVQAQFTAGNYLRNGYNSHLPAVTDFQLYYAMQEALTQPQGWTSGVTRLYYTLAQDFLYEQPDRNVLFLDNHDLGRLYTVLGGEMNAFRSGLAMLLTMRGIPMLYYGTEILLGGEGGAFGEGGRVDFPGGWPEDETDKFDPENHTDEERAAFDYLRRLLQFRKTASALHEGKLTQYVPEQGVYVYFRYNGEQTIMVVYNSNRESRSVDTARYRERMAGFSGARDITNDRMLDDLDKLQLGPRETLVLELE